MVHVKTHRKRKPLKITVKGNFIRERMKSPRDFDRRSLRTVKVGKHRVITGCPPGHFHNEKCDVGLRTQAILHPKSELGKKFKRSRGKVRRVR